MASNWTTRLAVAFIAAWFGGAIGAYTGIVPGGPIPPTVLIPAAVIFLGAVGFVCVRGYRTERDGDWHDHSPFFQKSPGYTMRRWRDGGWQYRAMTDGELDAEAERQIDSVL